MLKIGLTGGISSGKSTVAERIKQLNLPIIDADVIARQVVEPGTPALTKIKTLFGEDVLFEDGALNRKKLGEIIFSDEAKRQKLNAIVHPEVRAEMHRQMDDHEHNGEKAVVLDIPLLIESELMGLVDKILLVYVDDEIQHQRLMNRDGIDANSARQRMSAQMPLKDKLVYADAVINNNGSIDDTKKQLDQILIKWLPDLIRF